MTSLLSIVMAATFAAQAGSNSAPARGAAKGTKTITLSGCVNRDVSTPGSFTFVQTDSGARYRLTGVGMRKYVGQRVEVFGGPQGRRLTVRGGLLPSPNVAAQAGALDPTKAAVAGMPAGPNTGTGSVQLPEFRVTRVRSLGGSCE
jgi:hypothetical protein